MDKYLKIDVKKIQNEYIDQIMRLEDEAFLSMEQVRKEGSSRVKEKLEECLRLDLYGDGFDDSWIVPKDQLQELLSFLKGLEKEGFFDKENIKL